MSITAWFTACQWLLLCGQTDCHPRKKRKLWRGQFLFVVWNVCGFLQLQKLAADWAKIISIYSPKKKINEFPWFFCNLFFYYSLQSIFARSIFDAWSRFARIIRHTSLVQQHISNAVCNAMVSGEGEYMTITYFVSFEKQNKKRISKKYLCSEGNEEHEYKESWIE